MVNRFLQLIVCSLCVASFSYAAESPKPDPSGHVRVKQAIRLFDEWAQGTLASDRIPGASVALVSDQVLVWSNGYGYSDLKEQKRATADTLYGICSISKLFTSIAVLQQRDAGKLRLDDPVVQYLPYANLKSSDSDSPPVTIHALLTHSSGLPRESAHPYWTDPDFPFPTKEEVVSGLDSQKMLYASDRYFQYSNLGITLAGEIVEKVSSKTYEEYVLEQILKPLGLSHTTPFLPEDQKGKMLATGYAALDRKGERELMPFYQTRGIAPAAGFASNVKDLGSFASWQFRLLAKGGTEVLKASTLREMQRVHWTDPDWKTTWGLGFWVGKEEEQTRVGHSGACPGYFTTLLMDPKKKLAATVMMNAMNVSPGKFAAQLLKIVGPAIEEALDEKREKPKPPPVNLDQYSGLYWSAWGEAIIVPWKEGLAALDLPSSDPIKELVELKHVAGNTFRRIRKDGDEPGEEVLFETGADGKITRVLWHQNYSRKIR